MTPFIPNTEGIWLGLPDTTYRQAPGVNITSLKPIAISPAHYHHAHTHPKAPSQEMIIGTIIHAKILEPGKPSHIIRPEGMDYRSKAGKEWRDAQTLPILTQEENEQVEGSVRAFRQHALSQAIAKRASAREVSVFKRDERTGLLLKGRLDMTATDSDERTVIVDIKTTDDASPDTFPRTVARLSYHAQAAYYTDLLDPAAFFTFIAIEKTPPHAIAIYQLDDATMQQGRDTYRAWLDRLAECQRSDTWPAYPQEITTISMPRWAQQKAA